LIWGLGSGFEGDDGDLCFLGWILVDVYRNAIMTLESQALVLRVGVAFTMAYCSLSDLIKTDCPQESTPLIAS